MKKTLGNYLEQLNRDFPVDCETFDYIQNNISITEILGNIAGDKTIIQGCEEVTDTDGIKRHYPGYVFLRTKKCPQGEILYCEKGPITSPLCISEKPVEAPPAGYEGAYTVRTLAPDLGEENFSWSEFRTIRTNQELDKNCLEHGKLIAALEATPLGVVQMWAGKLEAIPANYQLCNGSTLSVVKYPELFAVLGNTHGGIAGTTFALPDLRSRFIAGYDDRAKVEVEKTDHDKVGRSAGGKYITLSANNIPGHTHPFKDYYYIEAGTSISKFYKGTGGGGGEDIYDRITGSAKTDNDNNYMLYRNHDTNANTGGGQALKYLPSYYTLAYIMRVK